MSDYKPITGELRNVYTQTDAYNTVFHTDEFERCCDAIDAIHAGLEREYAATLAEREGDWIKLPVDADGLPICAGDDVEWMNGIKQGRVTGIGVGERDGWVWVLMEGKNVSIALTARDLHHYVPDTWERIIEDAIASGKVSSDYLEIRDTSAFSSLVARCKALACDAS